MSKYLFFTQSYHEPTDTLRYVPAHPGMAVYAQTAREALLVALAELRRTQTKIVLIKTQVPRGPRAPAHTRTVYDHAEHGEIIERLNSLKGL